MRHLIHHALLPTILAAAIAAGGSGIEPGAPHWQTALGEASCVPYSEHGDTHEPVTYARSSCTVSSKRLRDVRARSDSGASQDLDTLHASSAGCTVAAVSLQPKARPFSRLKQLRI